MASSGVQVHPDCITKFNELKLGKDIKWIVYKISDDGKEIVVEESSTDKDYEKFREKLVSSQSKGMGGAMGPGPRYAVIDLEFDAPGGEGKRTKITFVAWNPDNAGIKPKMLYSSSKDALRRSLNGVAVEVQANDEDDIEHASIISKVSKGGR